MSGRPRTAAGSFRGDRDEVVERLGGYAAARSDDAPDTKEEGQEPRDKTRSLFGDAWKRVRR